MRITTPSEVAKQAGNKYLGVLVAAKFARYLNEFPKDHPATSGEKAPAPARHLKGHTNTINRLLTTPDQKTLLSASSDHTVRYWSADADPSDMGVVVLNARAIDEAAIRKKKAPAAVEVKVRVQSAEKTLDAHKDWVLGLSLTRDGNTLGGALARDALSGETHGDRLRFTVVASDGSRCVYEARRERERPGSRRRQAPCSSRRRPAPPRHSVPPDSCRQRVRAMIRRHCSRRAPARR